VSTVLLLLLALAAVLADIAVAPGGEAFGARAQVTLVVVALWAALRPEAETMLLLPVAGVLLGLLGNEPLGVSVLALAPIVLLSNRGERRSTERRLPYTIGLVVAGTLAYAAIWSVATAILGEGVPFGLGSLRVLLAVAILNCLLAALLYWPLAKLTGDPRPRNELRRS
jgi:rod shape-determining protein MreD